MNSVSSRYLRVAAVALLDATPALAQQVSIAGQVTDSAGRRPLVAAQVFVGGTTLRTLTDQQGRCHVDAIAPGAVTVRVALIGYKQATRVVTVAPAHTGTPDFTLGSEPVGSEAQAGRATW